VTDADEALGKQCRMNYGAEQRAFCMSSDVLPKGFVRIRHSASWRIASAPDYFRLRVCC